MSCSHKQAYKGSTVEFFVSAVDYDECTKLTLEATSLPSSGELFYAKRTVSGVAPCPEPAVSSLPRGMIWLWLL